MKEAIVEPTLPIFDASTPPHRAERFGERLSKAEWSYSKRNELEQCPLKYYNDYYGASARTAKGEPLKELLRKLKRLHNRHERAGQILHVVIARYFRSARSTSTFDAKDMINWARKLFQTDLQLSRESGREIANPPGKFPPVQLLEFFHGQADAEELCAAAEAKLIRAQQIFSSSPRLKKIRAIRSRDDLRIEKKFWLRGFPCRVTGVVDFAARTEDVPGIFDWKIGEQTAGEDDSLQLTVYALWGAAEFECNAEEVRVFKVFLGGDIVVPYHSRGGSIETAYRRIAQDAERILEMDFYGRSARSRAFSPASQRRICLLCRYLSVCSAGKEAVYGRN